MADFKSREDVQKFVDEKGEEYLRECIAYGKFNEPNLQVASSWIHWIDAKKKAADEVERMDLWCVDLPLLQKGRHPLPKAQQRSHGAHWAWQPAVC